MQSFKTVEELMTVQNNHIIGAENLTLRDSEINFFGVNNIFYIEKDVTLEETVLNFNGSNSIIYLSSNPKHVYRLDLSLYNASAFFSGRDNYFNGPVKITLSERRHMLIGSNCLFSLGVWVRTADPHLVYDAATKVRLNDSESVYIGDHVWLGQETVLLKGTQLFSGSVLGARAVAAGKRIPSGTAWAGNPVKQIADGVFWDETCVHAFSEEKTAQYQTYPNGGEYLFERDDSERISFDYIDKRLNGAKTAGAKLDYLRVIALCDKKNRFTFRPAEKTEKAPKGFKNKLKHWLKKQLLKILK